MMLYQNNLEFRTKNEFACASFFSGSAACSDMFSEVTDCCECELSTVFPDSSGAADVSSWKKKFEKL